MPQHSEQIQDFGVITTLMDSPRVNDSLRKFIHGSNSRGLPIERYCKGKPPEGTYVLLEPMGEGKVSWDGKFGIGLGYKSPGQEFPLQIATASCDYVDPAEASADYSWVAAGATDRTPVIIQLQGFHREMYDENMQDKDDYLGRAVARYERKIASQALARIQWPHVLLTSLMQWVDQEKLDNLFLSSENALLQYSPTHVYFNTHQSIIRSHYDKTAEELGFQMRHGLYAMK